jgi:hypothetical protein
MKNKKVIIICCIIGVFLILCCFGSVLFVAKISKIEKVSVNGTKVNTDKDKKMTPANTEKSEKKSISQKTVKESKATKTQETTKKQNQLILSLQERPLMNGTNTKRIGTYGRTIAAKEFLSDKMLLEFDKYIGDKNLYYVIIDFGDGTGFDVISPIYSYCKVGKDNRGIYENQGDLGSDVFVYSDENKVNWGDFKK